MNPEMPSLGAAQAFAIGLEADLEAGMRVCEQDQLPDDLVSLGRLSAVLAVALADHGRTPGGLRSGGRAWIRQTGAARIFIEHSSPI
jgi:hypothetical protein